MFEYLDKDRDGHLTYKEFSDLCEERRRNIDPFDKIVEQVKLRQQQRSY